MCKMEEDMRKLTSFMEDMKNTMEKNATQQQNLPAMPAPQKETYSDKAKKEKSVIVIKKQSTGESADIKEVQQIAVRTGSAVASTYKNPAGHTVVVCENKNAQEKMKPALEESMADFTVVTPPKRQPAINIAGLNQNLSKEQLFDIAKAQNRDRGINITPENFKVIFIKPQTKKTKLFHGCS